MIIPTPIKAVGCLFAAICVGQPALSQETYLEAEAVAGQAAATYAFQVKQCAEQAGDIPDKVVDEIISRLAGARQFYIGAEYTFDLHFGLQWNRAETGEITVDASEERCASIIGHLRHLARNGS